MKNEVVIQSAVFSPKVKTYWALASSMGLFFSIIGIPFLIIWIPAAILLSGRYLASLDAVLTAKTLKVKKGILNRVEKTVPLEKITDMGMVQGPLMRALGISMLTVETAGGSAGALVNLLGVENPERFRDAVLQQKELLIEKASKGEEGFSSSALPSSSSPESTAVLSEILETLKRIENKLPGE